MCGGKFEAWAMQHAGHEGVSATASCTILIAPAGYPLLHVSGKSPHGISSRSMPGEGVVWCGGDKMVGLISPLLPGLEACRG